MASDELRKFRLQRAKDFAAPKPTLPDIAKKADDLQAIKDTVDSAATVSGALWLSYLFVMFYIAVAAGAVTHEDLLLQRPVKLPFLNVELPLLAFFFLAPLLFVATHIYTIVHFNMLGQKAARFNAELHHQLKDEKEIRDKLRRLLPSNVLVQIFAGPPELRDGRFGLILKAIVILTLLVCPVLLLLLLQIQFLPYHAGWITWTQRGALMFDIAILWVLRPPTLLNGVGGWSFHGGEAETAPKRVRAMRGAGLAVTGVLSLLAIWFSVVVATIPNEWQEKNLAALDPKIWPNPSEWQADEVPLVSTRERLFAGEVDPVTRRRKSLFSNTLVLPGFDVYVALKVDDKTKLDWKDHLIDLRGRALDRAVFWGAKLPKADLKAAQLQGASLDGADLQGASLVQAQLQGASLDGADLQDASLVYAQLQGVA
ncbi:MAG: pentapeptide repeat-containing protein [Methylocystis sp.]|uniref:pentapeptide repeat-containing protein n=1 Tax=Methylocystis sp. TaxID=1911079 RepID=UPI003934E2C8